MDNKPKYNPATKPIAEPQPGDAGYNVTTTHGNQPVIYTADSWEGRALRTLRRLHAEKRRIVVIFELDGGMMVYRADAAGRVDN